MKKNWICLITEHGDVEQELVMVLARTEVCSGAEDDYIVYTFSFDEFKNELLVINADTDKKLVVA